MAGERIAILGAGAMGSAMTAPAVDASNEVRLWGTWLDDELVDAVERGEPHPRIDVVVDERVRPLRSDALAEALQDTKVVVVAITSGGVLDVIARAGEHLADGASLVLTTRGFGRADRGHRRPLQGQRGGCAASDLHDLRILPSLRR